MKQIVLVRFDVDDDDDDDDTSFKKFFMHVVVVVIAIVVVIVVVVVVVVVVVIIVVVVVVFSSSGHLGQKLSGPKIPVDIKTFSKKNFESLETKRSHIWKNKMAAYGLQEEAFNGDVSRKNAHRV